MLFNSLIFILFFGVVLLIHFNTKKVNSQNLLLVLASYIYYSTWNPLYLILLLFSTLLDWFIAKSIFKSQKNSTKKFFLFLSFFFNFGILFSFKANSFLIEYINLVVSQYFPSIPLIQFDSIIVPIGLSFYTFQTISYSFDVYKNKLEPVKSFLDYALYVTFFSQLIAGPILKASEFIPQTKLLKRFDSQKFSWGLFLFTLGIFQKTIISDLLLSSSTEVIYSSATIGYNSLDAIVATLSSGMQIYFDFAGYSLCAIGTALCLGFHIPNNFWAPFGAIGFLDLWRRWHMSFWQWAKDYFYIPLGGSRKGTPRMIANMLFIFAFSGLWHGMTFPLLLWGLYNSIFSLFEVFLRKVIPPYQFFKSKFYLICLRIFTATILMLSVPLFRSHNLGKAQSLYMSIFGAYSDGVVSLTTVNIIKALIPTVFCIAFHWYLHNKSFEEVIEKIRPSFIIFIWIFMSLCIFLNQGVSHVFIYFQF